MQSCPEVAVGLSRPACGRSRRRCSSARRISCGAAAHEPAAAMARSGPAPTAKRRGWHGRPERRPPLMRAAQSLFQGVSCWPVPPWQRRGQVDPRCRPTRRNALPGRGCGAEWTERRCAGRWQGLAVPRDVTSAAQPVRHAHGSRPARALPRVARQQNLRARAAKRHFFSRSLSDKEVEVRHGAAGLKRKDDEDKPQTGLSRPIPARRERRRDAARGPVPS